MVRCIFLFLLMFLSSITFGQSLFRSASDTSLVQTDTSAERIVYVNFIVEADGSLGKAYVDGIKCLGCNRKEKRYLRKTLGKLALEAVKKMPNWKSNGKRILFTLPVQFDEDGKLLE